MYMDKGLYYNNLKILCKKIYYLKLFAIIKRLIGVRQNLEVRRLGSIANEIGYYKDERSMGKQEKKLVVKNAIKGDPEAFGVLIKSKKEYLYKMAYLYVKNEEEALEVLQETAYRGFLNIRKLKNHEFFKTWITRILINAAADHIKRKSKVVALDENIVENRGNVGVDEKVDLYSAIDLLRDNYKTVIIMKYFNDMKLTEISEVMNLPEGTVKTYLSRAKKELKDILKEGYLHE